MPHTALRRLPLVDMGLLEYGMAWALQKRLHEALVRGEGEPCVLLVEHPPVLTLGKHAKDSNLLFGREYYRQSDIPLYEIDRGGEVTAHEPGQLVAYPILALEPLGLTPRKYVRLLEDSVIETLARFGVKACVDERYPGVWVGSDKICAIGVRIKERVTMHGIGFNICNDLSTFRMIVPCGIQNRGVTTLSQLLGRRADVSEVARHWGEVLARRLTTTAVPVDLAAVLPRTAKEPMISV